MGLPSFSVNRPVTTIMMFTAMIVFGFICWSKLPQELYPPITYPQLSVVTYYKDAAPEEIETLITKPIEEQVGTVSGVRKISSTSKEEVSLVVAEFNWGTNMDFAALGVREKIDLIKLELPRGAEDPIVMKFNPFEMPLIVLNITADKTPPAEVTRVVKKFVKGEVEKADGVAATSMTGGLSPEIIIEIDQDRLMSKGIALNRVVELLGKANLNYPAGTIEESFFEYLVRTMGEFKFVDEMKGVVVGLDTKEKKRGYVEFGADYEEEEKKRESEMRETKLILLKEIASVKEGFKEKTSISRYNGKENISISVQKQAEANTITVANNVKKAIVQLERMIPRDMHVDVVYDSSEFIRSALAGVTEAAIEGGFLAFLVLLLFLRSATSSLIVTMNIPICVMAVFSLMYMSGLTLNMISLGGLALGVGMVVDNGIVVVENIYRHREEEKRQPKEASIYGAEEVGAAVAGSTLTTVAVFLPMVFVIGIAGQLFKELAFTVTFSMLCSLFVSMTLMPVLAAREKKIPVVVDEAQKDVVGLFLRSIDSFVHRLLVFFLDNKALGLGMVFLLLVGCFLLAPFLQTEFLPKVDQGQFIVKVELQPGTRLNITDMVARRIESYLREMPEVKDVTVNIGSTKEEKGAAMLETMGPHQGRIIVNLVPKARLWKRGTGYRTLSSSQVLKKLKDLITPADTGGAGIEYVLQESIFSSAFAASAPVVIEIKGQDLEKIRQITKQVEAKISKIKGIYGVRDTLVAPAPEVKVTIFKDKAATYSMSTSDIAVTAQTAVKGTVPTKFKREGEEIDVKLILEKADRDNIAKVRQLDLQSPLGISVPLAELAYFSVGKGPSEIKRLSQERVVVTTANIAERSFSDIADEINKMIPGLKIPPGYSVELTGEREQMKDSFNSLMLALILSVLLVFMIMASQFESYWQPFLIMFTVPLSFIGIILTLFLLRMPISVMAILGIIMLGGIVVNNGIILIDYTNILRKEGLSAREAVILASKRRLRPILMTQLTTILGLAPLAFGISEGSELQQPMAITVIGGLTVSTFLSLIVIPTIYIAFENILNSIRARFGLKPIEVALVVPPPAGDAEAKKKSEAESARLKAEEQEHLRLLNAEQERAKALEREKLHEEMAQKRDEAIREARESRRMAEEYRKKAEEARKKAEEAKKRALEEARKKPQIILPGREIVVTELEQHKGSIPDAIWDELVPRQKELIGYLRKNKRITRADYARIFEVSVPTAARDLKMLTDKHILIAKGPLAIGRYYLLREGV